MINVKLGEVDLQMTTYQILCIAGIPSLISMGLGYLISYYARSRTESKALKEGVQALLRNELYKLFHKAEKAKYCSIEDKQNFENMYKHYHSLGENGVMDGLHEDMKKMPTIPPDEEC